MLEILKKFEYDTMQLDPIMLIALGLVCVMLGLFVWLGGLKFRKIILAFIGAIAGGVCGFFASAKNLFITAASAAAGAVIAFILEKIFVTILSAILAAAIAITFLFHPKLQQAVNIKDIIQQIQSHQWVIIVALPILLIIAGCFLWRLTSAMCYSTLGTVLIFAGMIMLLLFKRAMPITAISNRRPFFAAVIIAMIAFGTLVQVLLCGKEHSKILPEKENK